MKTATDTSIPSMQPHLQKKHYRSPELSIFGTITFLTKANKNGPGTDGTMINMRAS